MFLPNFNNFFLDRLQTFAMPESEYIPLHDAEQDENQHPTVIKNNFGLNPGVIGSIICFIILVTFVIAYFRPSNHLLQLLYGSVSRPLKPSGYFVCPRNI
jgi:hypothetical protein